MRVARRAIVLIVELAGILVLLAVFATAGLAWRLTQGPLDVTAWARLAAERAVPGLTLGRVTLALDGSHLRVAATALQAGNDGPAAAAASITLETLALLRGALRPRDVTADGIRLRVTRTEDGTLAVQGLPHSTGGGAPDLAPLQTLTHLAVRDASVSIADSGTQQQGEIRGLVLDLTRDTAGALAGRAEATVSVGAVTSGVTVVASRAPGEGASRLHATAAAVNPAALARLVPALAPLTALDATLALAADVALTPSLSLQHATLHAESGPGRAFLPAKGGGTSPGAFAAMTLDVDGDMHAIKLSALRLVLAPPSGNPPSTILLSGDANRGDGHAAAHLHVALDRAQMADLGGLWPIGVGGGARQWLVDNIPTGTVHDGGFDLTFEAGPALDDVALTAAGGGMQAEDVAVYWLRPVPPIEIPHVLLTLVDADSLTIAAPAARQGPLVGRALAMRVWGMATKDQFSQIDGDITGAVADVFALLKHPRLKLLSVHPIPVNNPSGQSATHLTVKLPLEAKVDFDSIGIHAVTMLTELKVPALAAGRDLDQGAFAGDITQDGLTLSGTARLAGIGSTIGVTMDFRSGPPDQVMQHVTVAARGDERALATAGLDTIGLLAGSVSAKLDYTEERSGHAWLQASADLREASLSTPLGWSKPAGPAASVAARVELNHGRLAGFDQIRGDGPGLSVRGRSELVNGWPSVLHVERCVIGRTTVAGTIIFPERPGEALRVMLSGQRLDISGPLSNKTTFEPATPATIKPGRPYKVDLRFDRLQIGEAGEGIGPVSLSASGDERRIAEAHFVAAGPEKVDLRIEPRGETRRVVATVADVGVLMHAVGSGTDIDQGALELEGEFDDRRPGSPLTGIASMSRFGVRGASVFGKLLQGMTLYGLVDALRGPGLVFDKLSLPFKFVERVLELKEARAFSSSLGVTAEGQVDFARHVLNLKGTIVPAYFFNTLPGRLPLIGRLFSPEPGGGLFAATFTVDGPLADPSIGVNPLATLTPGALRGLFGLFD